jgi:hypothetical protein
MVANVNDRAAPIELGVGAGERVATRGACGPLAANGNPGSLQAPAYRAAISAADCSQDHRERLATGSSWAVRGVIAVPRVVCSTRALVGIARIGYILPDGKARCKPHLHVQMVCSVGPCTIG